MILLAVILATKDENPIYLRCCIKSILQQTFQDFVLYIVTEKNDININLLKTYEKKYANINLLSNNKEPGVGNSRNTGIEQSNSKYIAIIDSDDVHHKDKLETQIKYLENNISITVLGTNIELIDSEGNLVGKRIYPKENTVIRRQFAYKMPIANPTAIFRRNALIDVGLFNNTLKKAEDYEFWLRFLIHKKKFANLNQFYVKYRTTIDLNEKRGVTHYNNLHKSLFIHAKYIWSFWYRIWFISGYYIIKNLPNSLIRLLLNMSFVKKIKKIKCE